jgi:hypothetical protein
VGDEHDRHAAALPDVEALGIPDERVARSWRIIRRARWMAEVRRRAARATYASGWPDVGTEIETDPSSERLVVVLRT